MLFAQDLSMGLWSHSTEIINKREQRKRRVWSFGSLLPLLSPVKDISDSPMHPLFSKASKLTETIIAAAIEVHRRVGPGLIESIYEWCLLKELELRGLLCTSQRVVVIEYKGFVREEPLRFDVMVENCVLVESKAVQSVLPIHKAQLLSYMKLLNIPVGLLINFHEMKLTSGVQRLILPGANQDLNLQEQTEETE